jgi:hypothetical protein
MNNRLRSIWAEIATRSGPARCNGLSTGGTATTWRDDDANAWPTVGTAARPRTTETCRVVTPEGTYRCTPAMKTFDHATKVFIFDA